jgi:hypothetical protein
VARVVVEMAAGQLIILQQVLAQPIQAVVVEQVVKRLVALVALASSSFDTHFN